MGRVAGKCYCNIKEVSFQVHERSRLAFVFLLDAVQPEQERRERNCIALIQLHLLFYSSSPSHSSNSSFSLSLPLFIIIQNYFITTLVNANYKTTSQTC